MKKYRITPRARDDLKNIGRYTEQHWGTTRRNTYLKELEARFEWLPANPRIGSQRSEIHEGYFSFPQGVHVVFYLIAQSHIDIIGIPHKEMDILSYFSD